MTSLSILWLVPVTAVLWRLAGGAWFAPRLPGRPVWYAIPLLAGAAWLAHGGWQAPLAVVAGLLFAASLPHGRWFTLGRLPREATGRAPSLLERMIEAAVESAGSRDDALCLLIIKILAFAPLIAATLALGPPSAADAVAMASPVLMLAGYAAGWSQYGRGLEPQPTAWGEWTTGALVGVMIGGLG